MMKTQSNQQNPKQGSTAKTIFLKVIPLVLTAWLAIYTLTMGIAVHKQVKAFQSQGNQGGDTLSWSSEEWQLLKDKTFLEARIALAGDDSIAMTIDFQDSIIRLETKGVVLREVKFGKVEISRFFKALKPLSYAALFSKPFMITEIEGSIVKEPIQVKKAPRDSTEAAQNITTVDTSRVEFVEWHLQLDSVFVVSFVQSERSFGQIDWPTLKYRLARNYQTFAETNRDLLRFRLPAYQPEVTLFIPGKETKSFYRALPPNGKVALKF